MAIAYEQVYQQESVGAPAPYHSFAEYDGYLVVYDRGAPDDVSDGQILKTSDGDNWSQLCLIDNAVSGIANQGNYCGFSLATYGGSLFISQYDNSVVYTNARILEWDGSSVTQHLNSVAHDNMLSYSLLEWDDKLWCVTDLTPFQNDPRRVVYHYNGASWTAITDYGGAAYLNYNTDNEPDGNHRHRNTRLFSFGGSLYLVAAHYDSAWGFQVWKFDATSYTDFDLVYETHGGYVPAAIILFSNTIYLFTNQLSGTSLSDAAAFYSSTNMTSWTQDHTDTSLGAIFQAGIYRGRIYFTALDVSTQRTKIYYFSPALMAAREECEITTLTSSQGTGGLRNYKNRLYAGKNEEIYRRELISGSSPVNITKKKPFVLTKWTFKKADGTTVTKYYSEIDIRSPVIFYDGRILGMSAVQRTLDDHTGMYSIADMRVEMSNTDMEFSKLLATYFIKNQIVEIYHGWADDPDDPQVSSTIQMAVDDYHISGSRFIVNLKDISKKYFERKVPFYLAT